MLKSIDILLGVSVVMLTVSLMVTVLTQAVTNFLQTRGRNLRDGIAGLLRQMHRALPEEASLKIAEAILTHPLIRSAGSRYGTVIHREELTALIMEFAADDGINQLDSSARTHLCQLLQGNGIDDPAKIMTNVRALALLLEQAHPELSNNQRFAMAFLQEAPSRFLAKMNGWFDPVIDRVADRFTNSTRIITFVGSLAVALVLQLDTIGLVNRLSADPALRQSLVEQAMSISSQSPPVAAATPAPGLIPALTPQDQQNLQTLSGFDLIAVPPTLRDWLTEWRRESWFLKLAGILLTAMLLSLGAPFWYNALKNLIRLRSLIAQKDDDQRSSRQTNTSSDSAGSPVATPALVIGERGDLSRIG